MKGRDHMVRQKPEKREESGSLFYSNSLLQELTGVPKELPQFLSRVVLASPLKGYITSTLHMNL
jgi:hypothetical protein